MSQRRCLRCGQPATLAVACVLTLFGLGCHAAKNKPIIDPVLSELLDKDHESEEVKRFARGMGEAPVQEPHANWRSFDLSFRSKGIRIVFGEDGKVGAILLQMQQPSPARSARGYHGPLPGGVDRDDNRQKVESKIGKADFCGSVQTIDCYERMGLKVVYDRPGDTGRLITMIIVRPEDLRKKISPFVPN
jgi:hypothetical protein